MRMSAGNGYRDGGPGPARGQARKLCCIMTLRSIQLLPQVLPMKEESMKFARQYPLQSYKVPDRHIFSGELNFILMNILRVQRR